jgi:hypothetical protein
MLIRLRKNRNKSHRVESFDGVSFSGSFPPMVGIVRKMSRRAKRR